jgi:hypothetical protein
MSATSERAETEIEKIHHWRLGGIAMGSRWLLSASSSKVTLVANACRNGKRYLTM